MALCLRPTDPLLGDAGEAASLGAIRGAQGGFELVDPPAAVDPRWDGLFECATGVAVFGGRDATESLAGLLVATLATRASPRVRGSPDARGELRDRWTRSG